MYFAYIKLGSGEGFQGSNPHRSSAYPQSPLEWVPGYNTVSLTCSLVFLFVFCFCFVFFLEMVLLFYGEYADIDHF